MNRQRVAYLISILNEYIRIENVRAFHVKNTFGGRSIVSVISRYIIIYVYVHRIFFFPFFLSQLHLQLVGPQFPNQGLNPGHGSESVESLPLGHQGLYGIFS